MNLARLFLEEGRDRGPAQRSLRRADEVYRQREPEDGVWRAHLALGYVAFEEGGPGTVPEGELDARDRRSSRRPRTSRTWIRALNELARVERLEGFPQTGSARKPAASRSISLMGSSDAPILAWAHRELGAHVHRTTSLTRSRRSIFETAIDLYERSEQPFEIAITLSGARRPARDCAVRSTQRATPIAPASCRWSRPADAGTAASA